MSLGDFPRVIARSRGHIRLVSVASPVGRTATNAAESLISRTRHVKRNVKRWRGGKMMLRWVAAGVLEAVKGCRRLKGHRDMPMLRAGDQQLGLTTTEEKVA